MKLASQGKLRGKYLTIHSQLQISKDEDNFDALICQSCMKKVELAYEISFQIKQSEKLYFQPQRLKLNQNTDNERSKDTLQFVQLEQNPTGNYQKVTTEKLTPNAPNPDFGTISRNSSELVKTANKRTSKSKRQNFFQCPVCPIVLSRDFLLKNHLVTQHNLAGKYSCDKCSKCFHRKLYILRHLISHSGKIFFEH